MARVGAMAVVAFVAASAFHTFSATGSDASGFFSYAKALADGRVTRDEPLAAIAKWTEGPVTLTPLGWRVGLSAGQQVPTYAVGLPLLLAPFLAVSLVLPLTFALAVTTAAAIACRLGGASAALITATWVATSPIALVQSMQVMSDLPVTAAWLICWWSTFNGRTFSAGVAAAMAILIRPTSRRWQRCHSAMRFLDLTAERLSFATASVSSYQCALQPSASAACTGSNSEIHCGLATAPRRSSTCWRTLPRTPRSTRIGSSPVTARGSSSRRSR
jgi:hypothetical protein